MAFMTTEISGTGTLTFRAKCAKSSSAGSAVTFDVYEEKDSQTEFYKKIDDTGDEWMICSYFKGNASNRHVIWRFSGWSDDDKSWVDQVHWYPGKSVTVQGNNIDSSVSAEVMEAILQNWDAILGENSTSISTVVATGPAVTNAVALLNGGYRPEVDTSVVPPTLTFNEVVVLDVSISEFSVTNLPFATLKATISPHGTPPDVGVWGAPTLTSGWSQVESEGDFSKFAAEGIVSFEFDVSTNRFFKVITK